MSLDKHDTFLVVGLGNPGDKYLLTRHNVGFLTVDWIHNHKVDTPFKKEKTSLTSKFKTQGLTIILTKPQTYMNLSGSAVQSLMTFYKIPKDHLLVVQDDVDMPFGALRFSHNRSSGGHNGIKDIHAQVGPEYARLKVGIYSEMGQTPMDKFVLMNFKESEQKLLPELLNTLEDAIFSFILEGLKKAANSFNQKKGYPLNVS